MSESHSCVLFCSATVIAQGVACEQCSSRISKAVEVFKNKPLGEHVIDPSFSLREQLERYERDRKREEFRKRYERN